MAPTTNYTTSSRLIPATRLEPSTFAPFGEVVQNPATHNGVPQHLESVSANQGTATKWLDVSHMQNSYALGPSRKAAGVVVNMFVCEPRELEEQDGRKVFPVKVLERHPFTPQMFVPLGVCPNKKSARYLVIVAPTLSTTTNTASEPRQPPPYPVEVPRRRRSLKDILLGSRPNPYTNDHAPSTTPPNPSGSSGPERKGPGPPDLNNIKAFIARGDQAVTYGPGTWHAPMVALGDKPIDFVVVQYANGVALEDCQEVEVVAEDNGNGIVVDVDGLGSDLKAKL